MIKARHVRFGRFTESRRKDRRPPSLPGLGLVIAWFFGLVLAGCGGGCNSSKGPAPPTGAGTNHFEYVFTDGTLYVYDMDAAGFPLLKSNSIPTSSGTRGATACVGNATLYVSFGGDGGGNGMGAYWPMIWSTIECFGQRIIRTASTATRSRQIVR